MATGTLTPYNRRAYPNFAAGSPSAPALRGDQRVIGPDMLSSTVSRDGTTSAAPRVTLEVGAYATLAALSLMLRLAAAGSAPLSPEEAAQALAAHHLLHGNLAAITVNATVAPTLLALQTLTFFLFGVTDWAARLPVVLLTALTPLALWLWRPAIGRRRALLAASLLTISPFWTAAGALGIGRGLAGLGLLVATGAVLRSRSGGDRRWVVVAGLALGLALGSAAEAWAALVLGAAIWLALGLRAPSRATVTAAAAGVGLSLVVATVGFLYPAGLQHLLELAASLFTSLLRREPGVLLRQALLLATYEPLLLAAGVAALLVRPCTRLGLALRLSTSVSLLLALLAGQPGFGMVMALPGLALLGARTLDVARARASALSGRQRLEVVAVGTVLVGYGVMALTGIARRGDVVFLLLLLTAVGIALALVALLWMRDGRAAALTGASSVLLALLTFWALASTLQGSTLRRSQPQELTRTTVAMAGAADLANDLATLSWSRVGFSDTLAVAAEHDAGPLVQWYLRGMRSVTWLDTVAGVPTAPALVTASAELELSSGEYVGQDYLISAAWQPHFDDVGSLLRWLLYREMPVKSVQTDWVSLWVLAPADRAAGPLAGDSVVLP